MSAPRPNVSRDAVREQARLSGDAQHNGRGVGGDLRGSWRNTALGRVQRDSVGGLECPEPFGGVGFGTEVGVESARLASVGAGELGGIRVGGYAEELMGAAQRRLQGVRPSHGSHLRIENLWNLALETMSVRSHNLKRSIQITFDSPERSKIGGPGAGHESATGGHMHTAGTAGHHTRWRPRRGAFLEAGAAVRTLVARLVTGAGCLGNHAGRRWIPRSWAPPGVQPSPAQPQPSRRRSPERRHHMYPSPEAREVGILLRISRELDVCGDLTATVDNPSELIAWASVLTDPTVRAWRPQDSGSRFVQVSADHHKAPVRGHVSAVLACEQHAHFWDALHLDDLQPGSTRSLRVADLAQAWEAMPLTQPENHHTPDPPPPSTDRAA